MLEEAEHFFFFLPTYAAHHVLAYHPSSGGSCESMPVLYACPFPIPPQLFLYILLSDRLRNIRLHFAQLDSHRTLILHSRMYAPLIYSLFSGTFREMTHAQKGAPIQLFWRELVDPLRVKTSAL